MVTWGPYFKISGGQLYLKLLFYHCSVTTFLATMLQGISWWLYFLNCLKVMSYCLSSILQGIQVENLSEKRITSSADAQDLLEPARKKLIFAETEMLRQSSRYELLPSTLFSSSIFFCQVSSFGSILELQEAEAALLRCSYKKVFW